MASSIVAALAALVIFLPMSAAAAPIWQNVSSGPGKRIELDRTSIKRDGATVETVSRMILDKELTDIRSGSPYLIIEVVTRYDCATRSASTLKRAFKKDSETIVRVEELKGISLPVLSGTLDDKVLREVCRPPKGTQAEVALQANEAAIQLRRANDNLLQAAKTPPPTPIKAAVAPAGEAPEHSPPPKAHPAAEPAKKADSAEHKPSPEAGVPPPHPPAAQASQGAPVKPPVAKHEGYMLELVGHKPARAKPVVDWGYDGDNGPEHWARLDPRNALCASGQRQSPIDIRDGIKVDVEPIQFSYRPSHFRIVDNGHSIEISLLGNSFSLTGKTYALQQILFHHPGEEKIDGRRFDMSAHLVHRADDGQLAIIAILLEQGAENPFIQALWNNLPLEKKLSLESPDATVDLNAFLPASRKYYAYMGSLTTPPCTEGVLWLVLKQPVAISQEQIDIFSRLYRNNARPTQPTAGRLIKEGR